MKTRKYITAIAMVSLAFLWAACGNDRNDQDDNMNRSNQDEYNTPVPPMGTMRSDTDSVDTPLDTLRRDLDTLNRN